MKKQDNYEDIIHLPHHVSTVHPQMSRQDRAAQFSAFRALTGYEEVIQKTQKKAEKRMETEVCEEEWGI